MWEAFLNLPLSLIVLHTHMSLVKIKFSELFDFLKFYDLLCGKKCEILGSIKKEMRKALYYKLLYLILLWKKFRHSEKVVFEHFVRFLIFFLKNYPAKTDVKGLIEAWHEVETVWAATPWTCKKTICPLANSNFSKTFTLHFIKETRNSFDQAKYSEFWFTLFY